jgi:hypothetical protein
MGNHPKPIVGDTVEITYAGFAINGTIVRAFTASAEEAELAREDGTDIEAGEQAYEVDDGSGDTRTFAAHNIRIIGRPS